MMDDVDLRYLDTKSLHAMFQRDPFKILARMAKEGGFDLAKTLKKWDMEEHGDLTYSIYVIDFPSAVKVHVFCCSGKEKSLFFSSTRMPVLCWIRRFILFFGIISKKSRKRV